MRKFKKQVTAILLGIAIAVTQPGWGNIGVLPPISAEAAETGNNLFIDGDLGDDADDDLWTNPVWKFEDDGTGVLGQNAINYNKDAANNTTSGLGISKETIGHTSYEILLEEASIEEAITPSVVEDLAVIPSERGLVGVDVE